MKAFLLLFIILLSVGCGNAVEVNNTFNSSDKRDLSSSKTDNISVSSSAIVVNVANSNSVSAFLTSKLFHNADSNLSIKFYPEGYYELMHNYEVALTGKWQVGELKYDSSVMVYLFSDRGNLTMMLSTDGKIMDKATLKIFK